MQHLIVYKTAIPEIDVVVTNTVGIHHLDGQYFVFEVQTEVRECTQHYGPFMSLMDAQLRAQQSCEEIRHLATAFSPDDQV